MNKIIIAAVCAFALNGCIQPNPGVNTMDLEPGIYVIVN